MTEKGSRKVAATIRSFEWDENKRVANLSKHRIDFAEATQVFADPKQMTYRSTRRHDELRFLSIGVVKKALIAVVFTMRGDKIRIISARVARKEETGAIWLGNETTNTS